MRLSTDDRQQRRHLNFCLQNVLSESWKSLMASPCQHYRHELDKRLGCVQNCHWHQITRRDFIQCIVMQLIDETVDGSKGRKDAHTHEHEPAKKDVHAHLANAIATALWMCATSVASRCVPVALCFCVLNANKLFCSSISDLWSNYWIKKRFFVKQTRDFDISNILYKCDELFESLASWCI